MSIQGTYAFVYSGVNGFGIGVFTVVGDKFEGVDYVGGRYSGTARENDDGSISIAVDFVVRPGMVLVQGTAPQDVPHSRRIEHRMPPGFGDGAAVEIASPPGVVTVMVKQVPDDYARALTEGVTVSIGPSRLS
jgi:hypothetical protein